MTSTVSMIIEVVLVLSAPTTPPTCLTLAVPVGCTLEQALAHPQLRATLAQHQLQLSQLGVAVFGKRRPLHESLDAKDRIELLPPLKINPKEARRQRAKGQKSA